MADSNYLPTACSGPWQRTTSSPLSAIGAHWRSPTGMMRQGWAVIVEQDSSEIDELPAHHAVRSRDRPLLDQSLQDVAPVRVQGRLGTRRLASIQPSGPFALTAKTQSRTVRRPAPPIAAASVRETPAWIAGRAMSCASAPHRATASPRREADPHRNPIEAAPARHRILPGSKAQVNRPNASTAAQREA